MSGIYQEDKAEDITIYEALSWAHGVSLCNVADNIS